MKMSQFKNLIKEAVREVLQEEMRVILKEELHNVQPALTNKNFNFPIRKNYEQFLPQPQGSKAPASKQTVPAFDTKDPIQKLLNETAKNMSVEEYSQVAKGVPPQTPQVMPDVGEMEDWAPESGMKMPNFPM